MARLIKLWQVTLLEDSNHGSQVIARSKSRDRCPPLNPGLGALLDIQTMT
ncbi:hypothetical protein ACFL0H_09375 [Thermodesulfobacteriota bacterium]